MEFNRNIGPCLGNILSSVPLFQIKLPTHRNVQHFLPEVDYRRYVGQDHSATSHI
jgi:hypothetical protein